MQRIAARVHNSKEFVSQFTYRFSHRSCGIVGLPNVGKSSLFAASTPFFIFYLVTVTIDLMPLQKHKERNQQITLFVP